MKRFARTFALVGLTLLASAAGARERWWYAKSDHFEMLSSESEKESRRLLEKLEQFRAFFLQAMPSQRSREPRTFVVVFGSDRRFRDYKPRYQGRPKDVAGYCTEFPDEALIALTTDVDTDPDDDAEPTRLVFHEYVHLLLKTRGVRPPLWLNEGLADFYSTFEIRDDVVEVGRPVAAYVEYLRESAMPSLRELFATRHDSRAYNDENEVPTFYAGSWALTHYLVCGADATNRAKLSKFMAALDGNGSLVPTDPAREFEQAFGISCTDMERILRGYLENGRYGLRRAKLPLPHLADRLAFRPATDLEVTLALLDLKWRVPGDEAALGETMQLADQNPQAPRPQELIGEMYDQMDRPRDGLPHWQKAAELKSDNPYVYVRLARDTLDRGGPMQLLGEPMPEDLTAQVRDWVDRALQLDPNSADALELLAITEAQAKQIRPVAVNRVQAGFAHIRDPLQTLFALGVIRLRAGDAKTAAQIAAVVYRDATENSGLRPAALALGKRATSELAGPK